MNETVDAATKKKGKGKIILVLLLTLALAVGAFLGIRYFRQSANYLTTDNARITTNIVSIVPSSPGTLERFSVVDGSYVMQDEVLGWVENGESFRSPFDGVVVRAYAKQGYLVSPMEALAVIADTGNLHIQANIEETDISKVQRGQAVTVTIDALGREQFAGYVSEIGRVTDAEITGDALFFNTGGTFTKVTQLIPVRINIIDDIDLARMIGLNVTVRISLRSQPEADIIEIYPPVQASRITGSGTVESVQRRSVYTTHSFIFESVNVEVGDYVTQGQILGVLDTGDLELMIKQLQAEIEITRQSAEAAIGDSSRMLDGATANLENNANMHILDVEASLVTAEFNLTEVQRAYDDALSDYRDGNDPHILAAETASRDAGIYLETSRVALENATMLYEAGGISRTELRGVEDAYSNAQNAYNDASTILETAAAFQRRTLEQFETALQAAITYNQQAQRLLNATNTAALQEIDLLRGNLTAAEILANTESQEIALQMLQRQLDEATIRAPVSGVVTAVYASEGAFGAGVLFVIEDTGNLRITAFFREYDIARIETGMEVSISSDATGDAVYTGAISRISPAATTASPVVEFEVEITVTSRNTGLRIGTNTRLNIIID